MFLDVNLTLEESSCLKMLPECAFTSLLVYLFKRNSPYTKIFDEGIRRIVENGFLKVFASSLNQFDHHNNFESLRGDEEVKNSPKAIGLRKLQGAFYVLAFGHALAIILLVLESFARIEDTKYCKQSKKRTKDFHT